MNIESNLKKIWNKEFYLFLFLIAILLFLSVFAKSFFEIGNLMNVINRFNFILIAAVGMNMIIITSNIDVSAGALISVLCIVAALLGKQDLPIAVFLPVTMLFGGLLSLINGAFITKLRIPAIVATLATTQLFQGILPLTVKGSIYDLPGGFTWLAYKAKIFGVFPGSTVFMLIVTITALLFMKYSKFSRKLYAIGNNKNGARLAGVNVDNTVMITYAIAGVLYGITAVIIASASQRVTPTMANGNEMIIIAAVVLGGTSTAGGTGKITGTIVGAMILALVSSAINHLGINPDWADAIMGAIIILSVVSSAVKFKKKRKILYA